jgi:type II secretory pathway component PulF
MKLAYQAYDQSGKQVSNTIEAATEAEATEQLRRKGLFVANLVPAEQAVTTQSVKGRIGKTTRLKNLTSFCRQMHVLIGSGTPQVESLEALERQTPEGIWRDVIHDVRLRVEEGAPMSEAMERHPTFFDSITRSMIAAGESSGEMCEMLHRLGTLVHRQLQVRKAVLGAMSYPLVLVSLSTGVLAVLLIYVIPRFGELFLSLDVPLPATTQALLSISAALQQYWWAMLGGLALSAVGGVLYLRSESGGRLRDTVLVRAPKIGMVTRNVVTARITRLLGAMLESKVPVLESLQLTRKGTGNCLYEELIVAAEDAVTRGEPISTAFNRPELVSPSVYEAIRSGENSGQVGPLLLTLSEFLDEENEVMLRSLTSIIEPLILIFMGLVVGVVAGSMFVPLFDLTATASGGA